MSLVGSVGGMWKRVVRSLSRRRTRGRPEQGLPEGLSRVVVEELCRDRTGHTIDAVRYRHLSGWKAAGAYRVYFETSQGGEWTVIYKNDVFDPEITPALVGLPVWPGPPEYDVYRNRAAPLADFVPDVYRHWELAPGRHYRYLLEDLRTDYRRVKTSEDHLCVALAVPQLQRAVMNWYEQAEPAGFFSYDREFSERLEPYLESSIRRYAAKRPVETVERLLSVWPDIKTLRLADEFHSENGRTAIHGDLNSSNVHLHRQDPTRMKIVDWEWAGIGWPHADLAALLKEMPAELEQAAVDAFAASHTGRGLESHWRLYRWCKIERGLLDIAFLAVQDLDSTATPDFNLSRFIEKAATRILDAYAELTS